MRGRKLTLTQEIIDTICKYIAEGNYNKVAAAAAGIPNRTFSRWMAEGKAASKGLCRDLWLAVQEAEKMAEIRMVRLIVEAAANDPKHAQWWLERKFHERWGRKDTQRITGKNGGPVQVQIVEELIGDINKAISADETATDLPSE